MWHPEDVNALFLLAEAKQRFRVFYLMASPEEEATMNALVLAHAAFLRASSAPRANLPPTLRAHLERSTDATERLFTHLREAVRASPTFARIPEGEQSQIARHAFAVTSPPSR